MIFQLLEQLHVLQISIKKINSINIKKKGDEILITISSKSFLQNQVRSIVGCLKNVSSKKWSLRIIKKHLNQKKDHFVHHRLQHAAYI